MIRFRLYYNKDTETEWLNKMAADGWALTGFCAGFYRFEQCEKEEYTYQVDLGDQLFSVSSEYRELMEELGVEIVTLWGYWIILRKRTADGPFELYTDVESQIEHYTKILRMFKVVCILEIICMLIEVAGGLSGNPLGWAAAVLLASFVLVCVNAVGKTKGVLAELEARKSGIEQENSVRTISVLLPTGLLINACLLAVQDSISPVIYMVLQILAIILMVAGLILTVKQGD